MNESFDGFFPGFLDSDGRPWFRTGRTPKDYERAIESALKIAALTHSKLFVPAGYFFDNPHLQNLILRYKGKDIEAQSFRLVLKNLVCVSPNQTSQASGDEMTDWLAVLHQWAGYDVSNHQRKTYLNCARHDVAIEVQSAPTTDAFIEKMRAILFADWGIDLDEYLRLLNSLRFSIKKRNGFEFDSLLRERLLTREELFFDFKELLEEKVNAIAESATTSGVSLSRSLMSNPQLCMQIGVPDRFTLTASEYQLLAPILGHYHHTAFAKTFAMSGVASTNNPHMHATAQTVFTQVLESATTDLLADSTDDFPVCWPMSKVTFASISKIREQPAFWDHITEIHSSSRFSSQLQHNQRLKQYARYLATQISLDFKRPDPKALATALGETMFTGSVDTTTAVDAAKFAVTFCRDVYQNLHKELQVRWFFRKIASEAKLGQNKPMDRSGGSAAS